MAQLGFMPEQEDEDELQDSSSPYDSISDRPTLDASSDEGDDSLMASNVGATSPSVKSVIASRRGMSLPSASPSDDSNDPLMQDYNAREAQLQKNRAAAMNQQNDALQLAGMVKIAQQAARGPQAPNDSGDISGLIASAAQKQGSMGLEESEKDMDRRQKILNAIEQRKSRESVAADNRALRQTMLQGAQSNQKNRMAIQVNRLLGQTEKELREDPIAKPSETNMASLEKSNMILNNRSVPLTPQMLSDAEQDIASALTLRGQGATEGKIRRTELNTIGRSIAEAKQRWGNQPIDLRKEEPQLVAQIQKMNSALYDDYKTTVSQRKHQILDDKQAVWGDDPTFANKLDSLRTSISKRYGKPPEASETAVAGNRQAPMSPGGEAGGGLINSANAGGPQTKKIGNDIYVKVDGGWQLFSPNGGQ